MQDGKSGGQHYVDDRCQRRSGRECALHAMHRPDALGVQRGRLGAARRQRIYGVTHVRIDVCDVTQAAGQGSHIAHSGTSSPSDWWTSKLADVAANCIFVYPIYGESATVARGRFSTTLIDKGG